MVSAGMGDDKMLWEEQVPLMRAGYHKELLGKAFGEASRGKKVFPPREMVFNSMRITSLDILRVVILGQDPYINEYPGIGSEAHGLCFSVRQGIPAPPSLINIFKEIDRSVYGGTQKSPSTDLTRWAQQGVLLLNASLTVIARCSNSHSSLGWQRLTDNIIETISKTKEHVVFMLWGSFAQKKSVLIDGSRHLILQTSHPSPLSAHRGFLGSDVFVKCNRYLVEHGMEPIAW
jgi:uracil-DNA glycosylase